MKRHTFKSSVLLMLASFIVGVNLTGCAAAQGSLYSSVMPTGTNVPITVTTSTVPVDMTAPVIDAMDITIPYGTSLRPEEMATITDDQDESPVLEIASVLEIVKENSQNTASTAEGSTLSATASTADLLHETAATNEPLADVTTENAAVAAITETSPAESTANFGSSANITVIDPTTDTAAVSDTSVAGAFATLETASEASTTKDGYLFSTPGQYSVVLKGTDKSGNESTKAITVTVIDDVAPDLTVIGSAFNLFVNDKKPDYAAKVTAIDAVDGDVKDTLTVDDSAVKYKQPGEYDAKLSVKDKSGNVAEKTAKVNISAGWKTQDGKRYYYSLKDGHLYHGWSHIDDKLYYFDPADGHLMTGAQTIDSKQYLLDESDGHAITGWQTIDGKKYYYSPDDGHMYHSWSNIGGKDYYFDPAKGCMLTGLLTINGGQYLLDQSDGHQLTGWQTIGGNKYYFSPNDGHMYHDWSNIDGTEYYFDKSDGHMYTGKHYVDGEEYDFGTSGAATKVVKTRSTASSGSGGPSGTTYIGNRKTYKFHYPSCSSVKQMKDSNKVYLDSRDEAINRGYVPCQRCHP